jgi:hypothetical protein
MEGTSVMGGYGPQIPAVVQSQYNLQDNQPQQQQQAWLWYQGNSLQEVEGHGECGGHAAYGSNLKWFGPVLLSVGYNADQDKTNKWGAASDTAQAAACMYPAQPRHAHLLACAAAAAGVVVVVVVVMVAAAVRGGGRGPGPCTPSLLPPYASFSGAAAAAAAMGQGSTVCMGLYTSSNPEPWTNPSLAGLLAATITFWLWIYMLDVWLPYKLGACLLTSMHA